MKTLFQKVPDLAVRLLLMVRARAYRWMAEPEAGIDSSTEKAIYIVGGVVLGLAVIGLVTAFVNGYLAKLP
jgi:hypothetical protein